MTVFAFFGSPHSLWAQDPAAGNIVVPPPRTITAELKDTKNAKIVDIFFFDEHKRACTDTFKLESSRKQIYAQQSATFRASVQRKCSGKSLNSPVPASVAFSVRAVKSKKSPPGGSQIVTPESSAASFTYAFSGVGAYQVTAVFRMNDIETHTLSITVNVLPFRNNVATSENTD